MTEIQCYNKGCGKKFKEENNTDGMYLQLSISILKIGVLRLVNAILSFGQERTMDHSDSHHLWSRSLPISSRSLDSVMVLFKMVNSKRSIQSQDVHFRLCPATINITITADHSAENMSE